MVSCFINISHIQLDHTFPFVWNQILGFHAIPVVESLPESLPLALPLAVVCIPPAAGAALRCSASVRRRCPVSLRPFMHSLAFPVGSCLCSGFAFQFFTELSPDWVSEDLLNPHHFAQASGSFCHDLQEASGHLWPNIAWTRLLFCTLLRLVASLGRGGVPRFTVGGVLGPRA